MDPSVFRQADADRRVPVPVRSVDFGVDPAIDVRWQRRLPEFAMAANSVSMMMPYVEPYVVRSVRRAIPDLDDELAAEARAFVAQESAHHGQHRRFNDHVVARDPMLRHVDRLMAWTFANIERRSSPAFGLAYAAGAETLAYAVARWVADHRRSVLDGAGGPAADLFVWHLAEEVEHKSVAFDVFCQRGGTRRNLLAGMLLSLLTLAVFTVLGTATTLVSTGRIVNPLAWIRLSWWCLTFVFELLPTMVGALLGGHHPDDLADPEFFRVFLADHDLRVAMHASTVGVGAASVEDSAGRREVGATLLS